MGTLEDPWCEPHADRRTPLCPSPGIANGLASAASVAPVTVARHHRSFGGGGAAGMRDRGWVRQRTRQLAGDRPHRWRRSPRRQAMAGAPIISPPSPPAATRWPGPAVAAAQQQTVLRLLFVCCCCVWWGGGDGWGLRPRGASCHVSGCAAPFGGPQGVPRPPWLVRFEEYLPAAAVTSPHHRQGAALVDVPPPWRDTRKPYQYAPWLLHAGTRVALHHGGRTHNYF